MIALTDCDIIIKTAAADLLHFLPRALNARSGEIYVAPTTRFSIAAKTRRRIWGDAVIDKAVAFASAQKQFKQSIQEEQNLFADVDDMDAGELVLFAATRYFLDARVATGDKKALRALNLSVEGRAVYERSVGRVICFEQVLLRLMDVVGFPQFLNRIVDSPLMQDTVVGACFAKGTETTESEARTHLERYVTLLRSQTGALLVD